MASSADVGAGLSGFLVHLLGKIYIHLPSQGDKDWLWLFLLMAFAAQLIFLPYLWRCVEADMRILRERSNDMPNQGVVPGVLWAGSSMFFFLWLFHTVAGSKLLEGRRLLGQAVSGNHSGRQLVSFLILFGCIASLSAISERVKAMASPSSVTFPYTDRGFLSLYSGGGVFSGEEGDPEKCVLTFVAVTIFVAHCAYWYWSDASVALMQCFLLASVVADAFRLLFVYLLHKRTFG